MWNNGIYVEKVCKFQGNILEFLLNYNKMYVFHVHIGGLTWNMQCCCDARKPISDIIRRITKRDHVLLTDKHRFMSMRYDQLPIYHFSVACVIFI